MASLNQDFSIRVVLVDDESSILTTMTAILEAKGYNVRTAQDGFAALKLLRQTLPDIIISDLRMPNMSGFELLSVVRRRFPEIPVIATSGDYDPLVLPPCVVCDAFFKKGSYQPPELMAKVAELLGGEHRPALWKGAPVPVWLPRGRDDSYIVTCTNCLR